MNLAQIETDLQSRNLQVRLKAIVALKAYPANSAVPILSRHIQDTDFLVRSFVARELGRHCASDAFAALLQMMCSDKDPNVRAEAANSLSLLGQDSIPHLVQRFVNDDHWLVRHSILAALVEMNCPEEVFQVCCLGLEGEDATVQEAAVASLGSLARSQLSEAALSQLLTLKDSDADRIRIQVAYALKQFEGPAAKVALAQLRQDRNHKVVGAAMEDLIS